ncbi:hypothetical protein Tco_0789124 [Tanacetum coccineum]
MPLEPRTNQDDFEPTPELVNEPTYKSCYEMKFSCMIGYRHVNVDFLPSLSINIMTKRFYNSIVKDKGDHEGKNLVGTLIDIPIFVGNFSIISGFSITDDMDITSGVVLSMLFCKKKESVESESFKSSTQNSSVNDFVVINIPEEDVEPKQIILDPDDQPMWESAKTVAPTPNSVIIQPDVDDNFVINSTHLNMIRENKFDGYLRADPHEHIHEFLAICNMFRYSETQSEAVKLLIYHFSLCDKAKTWFNELNEESITSWEQMRMENKFDGQLQADPHDHIREFLAICNMFKYGETQSEAVKLLIFPFSLWR